jgi:hypothetical protein
MKERFMVRWSYLRWYVHKVPQRIWMKLAWLMPKQLAYWATIRLGAHATTGVYGNQIVPDLYFMDALKRWEDS